MKFLDEQLKKLDTPYVDFYILHAMNNERMDAMQKLDYKRFYAEAIAQGKVRYPGFSFHDDAKAFLRILHDWDQWGMCQVQKQFTMRMPCSAARSSGASATCTQCLKSSRFSAA